MLYPLQGEVLNFAVEDTKTFLMDYYISRTVSAQMGWEAIRQKVEAALAEQGFGVLTEIDIRATMKKKLDKEYLPHVILGACNPVFADRALQSDPHISTMLPCNVTLRQTESGDIEVAAIDPAAAMGMIGNPHIAALADEVRNRLATVINNI